MRLDARDGDTNWNVFHVEECYQLQRVVWVDDTSAQWGAYEGRIGVEPHIVTHQARRIEIYPDRKLVLINPVADSESESARMVEAVAA